MSKQEKMENLSKKMKELNEKIKDSAETVAIVGLEAKDKLDEKIEDTKSNVEALKENYRIAFDRSKSKISSELLKARLNMDVAKEKIQDRKEARDKEKLSNYIDNELEYAGDCIALSLLAAEEAKLAFLEAVEAQREYDEKYKEKE